MFVDKLEEELNRSTTENGAVGYKTTGKELVDFYFKLSSYRFKEEQEIADDFIKVFDEDAKLAFKLLFYLRDVRGGAGERRTFRVCLKKLLSRINFSKEDIETIIECTILYGRFDDLQVFFDTLYEKEMLNYIALQLLNDINNMKNNQPVSLLSKWLPSIDTSSKETRMKAKRIISHLSKAWGYEVSERKYRKILSKLRAKARITERLASDRNWKEIDYSAVPSLANLRFANAFLKHDEERRTKFLLDVAKGEKKINAKVTMPHEIVREMYHKDTDRQTLELLWKNLANNTPNDMSNIMVVRDGSGSMETPIGSNTQAIDVATGLAIYFAERCTGEFKDKFITFSREPKLVSLSGCDTLEKKLERAYKENECSNTNLEATFDVILKVAVKNNLKQEEIPTLMIISDMEFDEAIGAYWSNNSDTFQDRLFEVIEKKWSDAGYELPKLIFWNVCSRTCTIPLTKNKNGVILLSGFSTAAIQVAYTGEFKPYESLVKILNSERYAPVNFILS